MGRSRILFRTLRRSSRALRLALTPSRVSRAAGSPNTSSSRCASLGRGLATSCRGGASVFSGRQVGWQAASRLERDAGQPCCGASPATEAPCRPSCFRHARVAGGDQLEVHSSIGAFFGRPRVTHAELSAAGLSRDEIVRSGGLDNADSFVPCSRVWPMGFPWSSCVAQATLLSLCARSSLTSDRVLAVDTPLPDSLGIAFAVAKDDLMILSDSGPGVTDRVAREVEAVMLDEDNEPVVEPAI